MEDESSQSRRDVLEELSFSDTPRSLSRQLRRKLSTMGRRRFLDTLKNIGLSGLTLRYATEDALASNSPDPRDEVTYPEFLSIDEGSEQRRGPIYDTIAYDWWVEVEAVDDAANKVQRKVRSIRKSPLVSTEVRAVGHRDLQVTVTHITERRGDAARQPSVSPRALREQLPDRVDGAVGSGEHRHEVENIPVVVRERERELQDCYTSKYRPVPGGAAGWVHSETATVATPAFDNDLGENVLITASHVVDDQSGREFYQPDPDTVDNKIGVSDKYQHEGNFDAATVDLDDGVDFHNYIAEDGGDTKWQIKGIVTWDTIKNNTGNGYSLRVRGRSSCSSSGELVARTNEWNDLNCDLSFQVDTSTQAGDSGGPHLKLRNGDESYIAGSHVGVLNDNAQATHMGSIENCFNVSVPGQIPL